MDLDALGKARKALLKALLLMQEDKKHRLSTLSLTATTVAAQVLRHFRIPFEPAAGYLVLKGDTTAVPHTWLVTKDMPKGDGTTVPHAVTDLAFVDPARAVPVLGQNVFFDDAATLSSYYPGPELPAGCTLVTVPEGRPQPLSVLALTIHVGDLNRYLTAAPPSIQSAIEAVVDRAVLEGPVPVAAAAAAAVGGIPGGPGGPGNGDAHVVVTEESPLARPPP